ncbi:MAG: hypothetical protein KAH22_10110 [Thiotrichaceae bacterium]|nr:hypothetical protein [Thiotrichaceae bacterium]
MAFAANTASANFFGGNDGEWKMGPSGPYWDESDWPQWTPMYWMQEMMDNFNGDSNNNNFGFSPNMNYNMPTFGNNVQPQMPHMQAPAQPTVKK